MRKAGYESLRFDSFVVGEENRDAYEVCYKAARLEAADPVPVVLVGESGSGKTHLLYSIVDHVRSSASGAGIVYISARRFPPEVEALIENPEPVDLAHRAILLVDDVDRFDTKREELAQIVRVFLENDHYVIFTSSVPPAGLQDLTPGLVTILNEARVLELPVNAVGHV